MLGKSIKRKNSENRSEKVFKTVLNLFTVHSLFSDPYNMSTGDSAGSGDALATILTQLDKINSDLNTIKKELIGLKNEHQTTSIATVDIKKEIDKFSTKLDRNIKNTGKQLKELKNENINLSKKIVELQRVVTDCSNFPYQNTVKLDNIPSGKNEELMSYMKTISKEIEFPFDEEMVDGIYRSRRRTNTLEPSILVKFVKNSHKAAFLKAVKLNRNKLNCELLGFTEKSPIYCNEVDLGKEERTHAWSYGSQNQHH